MLKKDVLEYFGHEEGKRTGGINKLSAVLKVSMGAISQWGDVVPVIQAIRLDKLLSSKELRKEQGLPARGRPQFNSNDYQ